MVAGMHRSGTSAATRVINLLGADITGSLLPAISGDNDRGYWESVAVYEIHERLLQTLGSSWDDPSPLPKRWVEMSAAQDAKHRLIDELAKDFPHSQLFVVKDPRIARLLPLWLKMLDELDIEPVVVIPFRNPLEIAASLEKRNGLPVAKSLLMYVRSNLEAERASRGRRRLFVNYSDLLDDWPTFAQQLGKLVAPHELVQRKETAAEIGSFLSADLHRNRSSRERLATSPGLAATPIEIHDQMGEIVKTGDEARLRASFDRLSATVDEATKLYDDLVVAERVHGRAELTQRTLERDKLRTEAAAMRERLQAELNAAATDLGRANRSIVQQDSELTAQKNAIERLNGTLELAQARLRHLESSLAKGLDEVEHLQRSKSFRFLRIVPSLRKRVVAILRHLANN